MRIANANKPVCSASEYVKFVISDKKERMYTFSVHRLRIFHIFSGLNVVIAIEKMPTKGFLTSDH